MALPHAPATEASVLASSLIDNRYWPLAESLDPDVETLFYEPDHARVAAAMHRLFAAGRMVTEDSVIDVMRTTGDEIEGGTRDFLLELALRASAREQREFKDQISTLAEKRTLRGMHSSLLQLSERARNEEATPAELAEAARSVAETGRSGAGPIKRFGEYIDSMDAKASYRIPTCLSGLNNIIGGWESGRTYAIGARPKVGKSALALNSAISGLASGAVVVVFSFEMSRRELWGRLLACAAGLDVTLVQKYLNKEMSIDDFPAEQREDLEATVDQFRVADLFIVEESDVRSGLHDVIATMVDIKARYGDRKMVVFVDYLQLLVRDAHETVAEVTNMTREFKLMAGRLDIPIVMLSQINRGGAGGDTGMPSPHHMRGSGSIEEAADVTILMHRKHLDDNDHPESDMQLHVALSRYSSNGWVDAFYAVREQILSDANSDGQPTGEGDHESRQSSRPAGATTRPAEVTAEVDVDDPDFDDASVDELDPEYSS